MSTPNDGGPAFPNVPSDPGYTLWDQGMSLRDWFAGQALNGLLSDHTMTGNYEQFADCAYLYADAMLKARNQ